MARPQASKDRIQSLHTLSEDYLLCRDLRHAWTNAGVAVTRRHGQHASVVRRVLACQRCTTQRHDHYAVPSWVKLTSTYKYPEGYKLPGVGHVRGEEVRQEVFGRIDINNIEDVA